MKRALALLFILFAAAAQAETPAKPDINVLVLQHSEEEVADNLAVIEAKKQLGTVAASDINSRTQQQQINDQIRAANEKYLQERRDYIPSSPEEYEQFTQSHQQRLQNLDSQFRTTNGTQAQNRKSTKAARQNLQLALFEARIDNPAFPVFVVDGTSWEPRKEDGQLELRVSMHNRHGQRFSLITPQRITQMNTATCVYQPIWGELWALRVPETVPLDPKAPKTDLTVLKIYSMKQIHLLTHAASAGCPFGQVATPIPKT